MSLAQAAPLEVWSFNLRTEFAQDGLDSWTQRREGVAELISQHKPAVVCTQEATPGMLHDLRKMLGPDQYGILGNPRSATKNDETAGMLYHHEQVHLKQHETQWLNEPGAGVHQRGWDARYPRTLELATFAIASAPDHRLRVLNTHFDHVGVQARTKSAEMIAEAVKSGSRQDPGLVQIVCGDFNSAKESSPFYKRLVNASVGLQDAARSAELVGDMPPFTIHKFAGLDFNSTQGDGTVKFSSSSSSGAEVDANHIDWVLWQNAKLVELQPISFEFITDTLPTGRYPSDHFPARFCFRLIDVATRLRSNL